MSEPAQDPWEKAKIEYERGAEHAKHFDRLRRQDLGFYTTFQLATITILKDSLTDLNFLGYFLSCMSIFIAMLALNTERRLSNYTRIYMDRMKDIERNYHMDLYAKAAREISTYDKIANKSNMICFPIYYMICLLFWIVFAGANFIINDLPR